jgi:C-terminal processing protease CtpA/Prc
MLRGRWRRDVRAAAQVSGIGVTLSIDKASGKVKVVDVVDGGPAATAGLKRGMLFNEVSFSERSARRGHKCQLDIVHQKSIQQHSTRVS